jgi:hypothetical protein
MVFEPPAWVPKLSLDPPDSISIAQFMQDESYGRRPFAKSRNPFTCGLTGRSYTAQQFFARSDYLARAVSKRMSWAPNEGSTWDKVIGIFSFNTVRFGVCTADLDPGQIG